MAQKNSRASSKTKPQMAQVEGGSASHDLKTSERRAGLIDAVGRTGAYGVLALLGLILEAVLLAWMARSTDRTEHIVAGVLMLLVLVALIGAVLVIERWRQQNALSGAHRIAANLDTPGVPTEEILRRPRVSTDTQLQESASQEDIISAPDGSYALARPSKAWSIQVATVGGDFMQRLGIKNPAISPAFGDAASSMLILKFREGSIYSPIPGRTRFNGRRVPILLSEPVNRALRIVTIPRRSPPFYIERSLYDNFIASMAVAVQTQVASLSRITTGTLPKTNRDMVTAEATQTIENVLLGDTEVSKVLVDSRMIAVRGANFDYILCATNFRVGDEDTTDADEMDRQVAKLLDSFRVSTLDPEGAELADIQKSDARFQDWLETNGEGMFMNQYHIALMRLQETNYRSSKGTAEAMKLLRPFKDFAELLKNPKIRDDELWPAMDAAERGDPARLHTVIDLELKQLNQEDTETTQASLPNPVPASAAQR